MNCAKRSPIRYPAKDGTILPMARSVIFVPGHSRQLQVITFRKNGAMQQMDVFRVGVLPKLPERRASEVFWLVLTQMPI